MRQIRFKLAPTGHPDRPACQENHHAGLVSSRLNTALDVSCPKHPALQPASRRQLAPALSSLARYAALCLLGNLLLSGATQAAEPSPCASEANDGLRLNCYDRAFARQKADPDTPSSKVAAPASRGLGGNDAEKASSVMTTAWELDPESKRGSFVLRTYQPNFLLPIHYSSNINRAPSSPTQGASPRHSEYSDIEAKLQISLRAKIAENLLLPGADLWFAYTQRSLWQIWDRQDSSPFRSTDYQPEAIYIIPVPASIGSLPLDWNLRMIQLGFAHQSNGQSDPLSRSWNRLYLGAGLEHSDFGVQVRLNRRLRDPGTDNNPDLTDYIGRGEIAMNWFPGPSTLSLTWRTNLQNFNRGALQFDWTHPVFSSQPSGLRWYAQLFTGYGETLLDYNHRQTSLGLGLSLFQF